MEVTYHKDMRFVLKNLIERMAKRDQTDLSLNLLAKEMGIRTSILARLVHEDPAKRVHNPRIDTLIKIVDFFKRNGFKVTVDDLLVGFKDDAAINVEEQGLSTFAFEKLVPVYKISSDLKESIGMVEVKLTTDSDDILALMSDENIGPMFKKGSVFIVDTTSERSDGVLVAAMVPGIDRILIRKLRIVQHQMSLEPIDTEGKSIALMPTMPYRIIGVVIQVNAKT